MKWCGKSAPPDRRRSGQGKPHRVQGHAVPGWSGRWERVDRCMAPLRRRHAPSRQRAGQRNDRPATRHSPRQGLGERGTELGLPSAADRHATRTQRTAAGVVARGPFLTFAPLSFTTKSQRHKERQRLQRRRRRSASLRITKCLDALMPQCLDALMPQCLDALMPCRPSRSARSAAHSLRVADNQMPRCLLSLFVSSCLCGENQRPRSRFTPPPERAGGIRRASRAPRPRWRGGSGASPAP